MAIVAPPSLIACIPNTIQLAAPEHAASITKLGPLLKVRKYLHLCIYLENKNHSYVQLRDFHLYTIIVNGFRQNHFEHKTPGKRAKNNNYIKGELWNIPFRSKANDILLDAKPP